MTRFAANLSMMFSEYAFLDRFAMSAKAGFQGVEFLFPYVWEIDDLATRLSQTGLQQVLFNLPPGDWDNGERGLASLADRQQEFDDGVELALSYAVALSCPRLHVMSGLRDETCSFKQQRACYLDNLIRAAQKATVKNIELLIEPINPHDMPRYFLNDFALALEILQELKASGADDVRLQFDIYHCQRIHGDVITWLERCQPFTRHLQIAGTPDRHEPDVGDLPVQDILAAVKTLHPDLWVGCEYRPETATEAGLDWLKPHL